jgi:hypothetical protein
MALRAGDAFLNAYIQRDDEAGLPLLSSRLRNTTSEDDLRLAISGTSNPHHQAFEVFDGRRLNDTSFEFQVHLYDYVTDQQVELEKGKSKTLRIVRGENETWLIDGCTDVF